MDMPQRARILVLRAMVHGTTVAIRAVYVSDNGEASVVWPTTEAAREGIETWLREVGRPTRENSG
ncbi:hypothetical protein [Streptomyces sp. NPDC093568]|uniref:hypothetical protein n=1 Tax=Streptomyces sp. NPDC093568 TaxID=3366041 RepID=UPI0038113B1D